ncbi:unnamed protein product [Adineta ricciae]|uniref:Uncharacterized protein n=1 Tax=Adineta ricciae TaxID=249248 RepID=A0A813WPW1_ADIRI|nr:unnamed protein product [Adineta ricciae]CAF0864483.1 unnamed protein product [Adineta ricciae]
MESKRKFLSSRSLALYGGHDDEINCLVFSNDLEILLTASINGYIRLWNTVFDHLTFKIHENAGLIRALAISNNDRYFASTANDTNVRLYETRTACLLYTFSGHTHPADCLHFSNDSQLIASGGWDCRTLLWNVITGEQMYDFHHHTNAVQSITFHPSLNLMATGAHDNTVFLYNFDKPLPVVPAILQGHFGNPCVNDYFRMDFSSKASAGWDKIIIIWQNECARIHARLFGHIGWIQAIAFRDGDNDDGSILASVDDESVCVWNILSGDCIHRLSLVNDLTCFVRFLPENGGLLVGGAVYELLADQCVHPKARKRTKHIREPATGEMISIPKQRTTLSRRASRESSAKSSTTISSRPSTTRSILRKTLPNT